MTRATRCSLAVKLNGVDCGGDGAAAVASPLLLCLFVPEWLAFCELEYVVGFLTPVSFGSLLELTRHMNVTVNYSVLSAMLVSSAAAWTMAQLTFAINELSARRGSTVTSSSLILRNGTLVDWNTSYFQSGKWSLFPSCHQLNVIVTGPYLLIGFRESLRCCCCFLVFGRCHFCLFLFTFWGFVISFSLSIGTCMHWR